MKIKAVSDIGLIDIPKYLAYWQSTRFDAKKAHNLRHRKSILSNNKYLTSLKEHWPHVLSILLDQRDGESLERLQLVSLEVKLLNDDHEQIKPAIKRLSADNNNFLVVNAHINFIALNISYFIRGAKKYFKPALDFERPEYKNIINFDTNYIQNFFSKNNQPNNIFYNHDLSALNGHPQMQVASEVIIDFLLAYTIKSSRDLNLKLTTFTFIFYSSILANRDFNLGVKFDGQTYMLSIFSSQNLFVSMKAV